MVAALLVGRNQVEDRQAGQGGGELIDVTTHARAGPGWSDPGRVDRGRLAMGVCSKLGGPLGSASPEEGFLTLRDDDLRLVAAPSFEVDDQPQIGDQHDAGKNRRGHQNVALRGVLNLGDLSLGLRGERLDLLLVHRAIVAEDAGLGGLDHLTVNGRIGRGEVAINLGVLDEPLERPTEHAHGEHPQATQGIERERTTLGELFGRDAEHRRPEE